MPQVSGSEDAAVTHQHMFPGTPKSVPTARHWLRGLLKDSPAADIAETCLSELVTNAVLHSRSAHPGGALTVRVTRTPVRLRVEVQDEGGLWAQRPPGEDHGRGLAIVEALTAHLHVSDPGTDSPARTVTFEMSLP